MVPKYLIEAAEDVDNALRAKEGNRHLAVSRALASSCLALNQIVADLRREGSRLASAFTALESLRLERLEYRDSLNELLDRLVDLERKTLAAVGMSPNLISNILDDSQTHLVDPDTPILQPLGLAAQIERSQLRASVCTERFRLDDPLRMEELVRRAGDVIIGSATVAANGTVEARARAAGMSVPGVITLLSGARGAERIKRAFKRKDWEPPMLRAVS